MPTITATPTTDVARWTPLVRVRGRSMQPTLDEGQLLFTRPPGGRVAVGDVVVLTARRGVHYVKRIAAEPGDLVELDAGRLFVNQRSCDGLPRAAGARVQAWRVPEGHFFVVGDNLRQSDDSRVWDEPFVPLERISGVALRAAVFSAPSAQRTTSLATTPPATAPIQRPTATRP